MRRRIVAALVLIAPLSRAQSRSLTVDYVAPQECPDRSAFIARVAERAPGFALDSDGPGTITARVVRRSRAYSGEVDLVLDRKRAQRRVDGASCAEVADALALIVALAIEPAPDTAAPASGDAPGRTTLGDDPAPAGHTAPTSLRPSPSAPPPLPVPQAPSIEAAPRPAPARRDARLSLGVDFAIVPGVTTDLLVSAPVFVELGWSHFSLRVRGDARTDPPRRTSSGRPRARKRAGSRSRPQAF